MAFCVFDVDVLLAPSRSTCLAAAAPGVCCGRRFRVPFRRLGVSPIQGPSPARTCLVFAMVREDGLDCLMIWRYAYQAPAIDQTPWVVGCDDSHSSPLPCRRLSRILMVSRIIFPALTLLHLGLMRLFFPRPKVPVKGPAFASGSWRPLICFMMISVAAGGR